jgi:hypothetical protein
MVSFHWYIYFVAALVPMIMGFIWYNPKIFGTAWMKAADMNQDKMKGANIVLIFGLAYLFSLFLAFILSPIVIHQMHLFSLFMNEPGVNDANSEAGGMLASLMTKYGTNFRTFKHGAFHGTLAGIFIALPIIGTNALFERKGFKYVAINTGFWIVNMALMGGLICAFL